MDGQLMGAPLDSVAHIIQTALTPVFLLTGVATLLNVLSGRLGRVNDLMRRVADQLDDVAPGEGARVLRLRLTLLQKRSAVLVVAMVSGALGGAATCGAILALFVGALRDRAAAAVLFAFFGLAVACTTGTLVAFLVETLLSARGFRAEAAHARARHIVDT